MTNKDAQTQSEDLTEGNNTSKRAIKNKDLFMCEGLLQVFMKPQSKETLKVIWRKKAHSDQSYQASGNNQGSNEKSDGEQSSKQQVLLSLGSIKRSYYVDRSIESGLAEEKSQQQISHNIT